MRTIFLFMGAAIVICGRAPGELPPSVYEQKQKEASEYVKIEVLRVEIEPGTGLNEQVVHLVAAVGDVMRTASDLKKGDIINISYVVVTRPPGYVGPGAIPILEERVSTVAYLQKKGEEEDSYTPAAGAMSFSNF